MEITNIRDIGDLMPKSELVSAGGRVYCVREADEAAKIAFKRKANEAIKMQDGKVVSFNDAGEAAALLVSLCVFDCEQSTRKPHEAPLGPAVVNSWSSQAVARFYRLIRNMSPGLDYDEEPTLEDYDKEIARLTQRRAEIAKAIEENRPDPKVPRSDT